MSDLPATPPGDPTDAAPPKMLLDARVEFSERQVGNRTVVMAHHQATGKFFQLGPQEHRIAGLLDGERGLNEIVEQLGRDGIDWEPAEVAELIGRFAASSIAHPIVDKTQPAAPEPPSSPGNKSPTNASAAHYQTALKALSKVISQRIPLVDGDRIATVLEHRFGVLFSAGGMTAWTVLVASGLLLVFGHRREFGQELKRMFDPGMWWMLIGLWMVAKVIHELGHAIAAKHHGVRVGKIGIMFFFLAPLAYVDVTDAWKLRSKWNRVQIALGGVYLELACAAIAAWIWFALDDGFARHLAAQLFVVAGPATLLVNANPLLRLDGYYVVSDLTEISNLRLHGRSQFLGWLQNGLVRIPPSRSFLSGWRKWFASVHAVASIVFQFIWMGTLVIGVSLWAKGLGVALATAAVLLWCVIPLVKWTVQVWRYPSEPARVLTPQRFRLLMLFALIATTIPSVSLTDSPLDRRVPVVVQFRDEQIARAATDAFVKRIHVAHGQRVDAGSLLIELHNVDLVTERAQMADELAIAEHRDVQFRRQGRLAQAAAEAENAASLSRQIEELDEQIRSLRVFAKRSGFVVGRSLDGMLGRFVHRGDELFRVCDPQEKQLLVSVGPQDVEAYQLATARTEPSHVRLRGGSTFQAQPKPLRPRANQSLPHPALAATVGGPLAVEPSDDPQQPWRVVDPQMESISPLDPITSLQIRSGQIGTMTIPDHRSMTARIYESVLKR